MSSTSVQTLHCLIMAVPFSFPHSESFSSADSVPPTPSMSCDTLPLPDSTNYPNIDSLSTSPYNTAMSAANDTPNSHTNAWPSHAHFLSESVRSWLLGIMQEFRCGCQGSRNVNWKSQEMASREPCYLVELLEHGWFEKAILVPKKTKPRLGLGIQREKLHLPSSKSVSNLVGKTTMFSPYSRSNSVDFLKMKNYSKNSRPNQLDLPSATSTSSHSSINSSPRVTDTDIEELQGFIDLGFTFPREAISPKTAESLPALKLYHAVENVQNKIISNYSPRGNKNGSSSRQLGKRTGLATLTEIQEDTSCLPSVQSEEVMVDESNKSCMSPRQTWIVPVAEDKENIDVKVHIKLWARTVATAVRQAC